MPAPGDIIDGSASFTLLASSLLYPTVKDTIIPGVVGEFGLLGPAILSRLMPRTHALWATRGGTRYAILGPSATGSVPVGGTLTLDWVQDAQPFAWTAAGPPSLLTMDWVKDAQPFVSNDVNAQDATLVNFSILASTSITATVKIGSIVVTKPQQFSILATDSFGAGSLRVPKPCETPGAILELSSNLPFGIWQTDPDAIFTWQLVFVCDRYSDHLVPVTGYLWYLDHNPNTVVDRGGTFTRLPEVELDLSAEPYGTGDWWFHVAAFNLFAVGPTASYNVKYNHEPTSPGDDYMRIDGLDTITHQPLVAYAPITPHVLSWSISTDLDPRDILNYEVQISLRKDFNLNPDSRISEIVLDAQSITSGSYTLINQLDPGVYYWRIRAFDGNQYSQWSPTGSFRINHPPLAPYDVSVTVTS